MIPNTNSTLLKQYVLSINIVQLIIASASADASADESADMSEDRF